MQEKTFDVSAKTSNFVMLCVTSRHYWLCDTLVSDDVTAEIDHAVFMEPMELSAAGRRMATEVNDLLEYWDKDDMLYSDGPSCEKVAKWIREQFDWIWDG